MSVNLQYDTDSAIQLYRELMMFTDYIKQNGVHKNQIRYMLEAKMAIKEQLAGLMDEDDNEIDYSDIELLRHNLADAQNRMEIYDPNNPFHHSWPYEYANLLRLYQFKCPHKNQKYDSLRGSPYRFLVCLDCKVELSGMEWKPSFLKKNNIDLSVFEDKKGHEQ